MSDALQQYLALLEAEHGFRELMGTLTPLQGNRMGQLKEHMLSLLSVQDKEELRQILSGNQHLTEEGLSETSVRREKHWARDVWSPWAHTSRTAAE